MVELLNKSIVLVLTCKASFKTESGMALVLRYLVNIPAAASKK